MTNKIILKKSSVSEKIPLTTDLEYGELALNYADGKLYFKKSNNTIDSFVTGIGQSGFSGYSGYSGYSGINGTSGYSGISGYSGVSGYSGISGYSGYSGVSGYSGISGALTPWAKKTTNYTAVDGDRIIADTSGGQFIITLPATPAVGEYVVITDGYDFSLINCIVARNGSTIDGYSSDVALDLGGCTYEFIYTGITWQLTATTGARGESGYSGAQGSSGLSGFSGYSGSQGSVGEQGLSGISGYSGISGFSGISGYSGSSLSVQNVTTNSTFYPIFTDATTGTTSTVTVSSSKLQFNPNSGILTAAEFSVTQGSNGSAALITTTTATNQVVDSISASSFRTVKYVLQVSSGSEYQTSEILAIHNGSNAYLTEYATIKTSTNTLATFDASLSNGNLQLLVSPTNAVTTIRAIRTSINI